MAGILIKAGLLAVALAVIFQVAVKDTVWMAFGIGRVMQPLSDFPYTCRKIVDPRMEACEDSGSPSLRGSCSSLVLILLPEVSGCQSELWKTLDRPPR